jgi:indolepyruvate ferredoxin oxidoreductase
VAINDHGTPTAAFVKNGAWANPSEGCVANILQALDGENRNLGAFDANHFATQLLGDSIYINPMVLGYAWQKGWIPLGLEALMRAIELNGVQVESNKKAFAWGRWCAFDIAKVQALLAPVRVVQFKTKTSLDELVRKFSEFLTQYQSAAYADTYTRFIDKVLQQTTPALAEAVARNLFKLMAYKDEYEVARLHTDERFLKRIADQFEGDFTLNYHLAPPLLARKNAKGELVKQKFGPSMLSGFKVLAKMRFLRGTFLDVFGYTEERRNERALVGQYRESIEEVLRGFTPERQALALEIARIPDKIKGYGHVKERHLKVARLQWDGLMLAWRSPTGGGESQSSNG